MIYKSTTIINKEGKWFVARSVESGVVSQGKTVEEAQKNLIEAVELFLQDNPKAKSYFSKIPALITTLEIGNA